MLAGFVISPLPLCNPGLFRPLPAPSPPSSPNIPLIDKIRRGVTSRECPFHFLSAGPLPNSSPPPLNRWLKALSSFVPLSKA